MVHGEYNTCSICYMGNMVCGEYYAWEIWCVSMSFLVMSYTFMKAKLCILNIWLRNLLIHFHLLMERQRLCFHLCLSTEEMGSHVIINHDALDTLYEVPSPSPSTGPTPLPPTWNLGPPHPWPQPPYLNMGETLDHPNLPWHGILVPLAPVTPLLVTSGGHHWRPVQTFSPEDPHQYWHLVATTEANTVGKWAVRILLECALAT